MSTKAGAVASAEEVLERIDRGDVTLWPDGNVAPNRLGWLGVIREMEREARELGSWAATIDQEVVVLLGMGGSSLGPAMLASLALAFGKPSGRRIVVCDTTDPTTVAAAPVEEAFVLVSSKSGTTLEPNVLYAAARARLRDDRRYAVITDPGTPLASMAEERHVNRLFTNRPDIGGRYSVLSYFGLVPAALAGYDVAELCAHALEVDRLEAVALGLEMGSAAREGRDKVTITVPPAQRAFGLWVEQLIAESTGKRGIGCVPVPTSDHEVGEDRFQVPVHLESAAAVAAQLLRFELATAAAGHALGIDPFDEPNVAESKANTARVLAEPPISPPPAAEPSMLHSWLEEHVRPGDYVSLQAYLPYGEDDALEALRTTVRDNHGGVAVTAGYGPRFLHSTGQLHKGGPAEVVAVQLVTRSPQPRIPIPGEAYDFGTLIAAQSIGDHESLLSHDRRVLRIALDDLGELG